MVEIQLHNLNVHMWYIDDNLCLNGLASEIIISEGGGGLWGLVDVEIFVNDIFKNVIWNR